ncbi:MAG: hypothetical protein EHM80_05940 [Nitrospiraceae bacterium]|nr:MAG: hypothetical protein EHM80_05940 [Nitrospiraceae bacterium]
MMETQYHDIEIQYYIAGRSATFASSMPVAGNLFHHAVEMLLKFLLIKSSYSDDQLKNKFGHDLNKLWIAVKSTLKDPALDKLDELISGLNDFEDLRYPGKGYMVSISVYKCKLPEVANKYAGAKQYQTCLEDIDEFVSKILTGRVNPEWLKNRMMGDAVE